MLVVWQHEEVPSELLCGYAAGGTVGVGVVDSSSASSKVFSMVEVGPLRVGGRYLVCTVLKRHASTNGMYSVCAEYVHPGVVHEQIVGLFEERVTHPHGQSQSLSLIYD